MHQSDLQHFAGPRLLADIGGTNARFALETSPHCFDAVQVLACRDYPDLGAAVQAYLKQVSAHIAPGERIRHAGIAIANPVVGDIVSMTNHHWSFSIRDLQQTLQLDTLKVVNDFTALAMALPHLSEDEKVQIGGGTAQPGKVIGLIGPGTGLGVSGIIPSGQRWIPLASEGGHVTYSPVDHIETALLERIWRDFPHVSAERLISGMGIELLYRVLSEMAGTDVRVALSAAEIAERARLGSCAVAVQTVNTFCGMLGTVAGNLAMTLGANGGVYIGGGIVPRLGDLFHQSQFRQRFEAKGRFSGFVAQIPTFLITAAYPAFLGVSVILDDALSVSANEAQAA
ncbi:glucokinase [Undibacterium squillarum]|uniref:Glucokinase n=1 Tax=Undibacterium squillarum TaxID=1131567 RepID=A0ABQ2Y1B8_9BURK|nr:glucokinase [Undibacterium squillarum]GGX51085.1 hypothetical protein GCM10010946_32240 [Undibacterium squillarum]